MELEVDAAAAEGNSFHFEAEALIEGRVTLEPDFSSSSDNALPREIDAAVKGANDLAGGAGVPGGLGDGAIGRDVAARNFADSGEDSFSHKKSRVTDWFHGARAESCLAN